uniref:Uncharacterized protein n=1 Tax=Oryza rufipogon TaxID=4529 RepID=A0A0E0NX63_ORYRU
MLHMRGIAPKLTRQRGIDDDGQRPDLGKKSSISSTAADLGDVGGAMAWSAEARVDWKAKWPTAALWTPRAASRLAQGVKRHD